MGRIACAAAAGAVPAFDGDTCESNNDCRVYIKTPDRRHIYYYAHLNVRTDADTEVRDRLESDANKDPADDLPPGSNPVTAGQKLSGLGIWCCGTILRT